MRSVIIDQLDWGINKNLYLYTFIPSDFWSSNTILVLRDKTISSYKMRSMNIDQLDLGINKNLQYL